MMTKLKQSLGSALDVLEISPRLSIWLGALAALVCLAGYALLASFVTSMEILEFSIKIPWAGLIATYIFLVASGSGLCIINALGSVFGLERYEMMAKRMAFLSLTTIVFGMLCILLHLGHPERMPVYNAISPNFRSAISWMGVLYTVYLSIVVVELWLLTRPDWLNLAERAEGRTKSIFKFMALEMLAGTRIGALLEDPKVLKSIGALAFVSGASDLSMLGSVFAHSESRALWYGPYYPVYFLVSAIFSGYAFLLAVSIITYHVRGERMQPELRSLIFEMGKVLAGVLAAGFVLTVYRMVSGLNNPLGREPTLLLLIGPFSKTFWIFEVGLMSVLPALTLLWSSEKKRLWGTLAGALMVLAGTYVTRYEFVVAGQIYPNIRQGLPSYFPTVMEILVVSGVLAAFLIVYTLGERLLSFKETPPHH